MSERYLYHGSGAPDILDILIRGLEPGDGRRGVSLATSVARARWWGSLKGGDVHILRLLAPPDSLLDPEDAFPADPRTDFTYLDGTISPTRLQIQADGRWQGLLDRFGFLLSEEELDSWNEHWAPVTMIS